MDISFIGSGNVATHLAKHLYENGHTINQIYSRNIDNAKLLAKNVSSTYINNINLLDSNVDAILVSVSDNAIETVINQLTFEPKLIVHTTGSVSIDILNKFTNYGVFYPLQTFSKLHNINMLTVPICLEASNIKSLHLLKEIANSISNSVFELTSEQRLQCHIAAVFANNFTNHMFAISHQILNDKDIPFDIIKPLILETANKVQSMLPIDAQTGPAVRNDTNTINHHLSLLSSPYLKKLYSFVSDNIFDLKRNGLIDGD